jgi:hypothetical protein
LKEGFGRLHGLLGPQRLKPLVMRAAFAARLEAAPFQNKKSEFKTRRRDP